MSEHAKVWLESMIGCDCDGGMRYFGFDGVTRPDTAEKLKCGLCVLVEVGGIRVRVRQNFYEGSGSHLDGIIVPAVPAVGVADE